MMRKKNKIEPYNSQVLDLDAPYSSIVEKEDTDHESNYTEHGETTDNDEFEGDYKDVEIELEKCKLKRKKEYAIPKEVKKELEDEIIFIKPKLDDLQYEDYLSEED